MTKKTTQPQGTPGTDSTEKQSPSQEQVIQILIQKNTKPCLPIIQ